MPANYTHRYTGGYARDFSLDNGKTPMLAPGDFLTLSKEDEDTYKDDIESGLLLDIRDKKEVKKDA